MPINKGLIPFPLEVANEVIAKVEKGSAFQRAARQVRLPGSGTLQYSVGQNDGFFVDEGAKKPVADAPLGNQTMNAFKIARITTMTNEFEDDAEQVASAIETEVIGSIARTFDKAVAGLLGTPVPAGFDQLSVGVSPVTVTDYATFVAALSDVEANGGEATAIVLTRPLLRQLQGITSTLTGRSLLNINATSSDSGDIEGVPYFVFSGTSAALGWIGDFTKARWGVVDGSLGYAKDPSTSVTIDGELVSMFETNQTALRVEGRFGFRVASKADYRRLTTAASGS